LFFTHRSRICENTAFVEYLVNIGDEGPGKAKLVSFFLQPLYEPLMWRNVFLSEGPGRIDLLVTDDKVLMLEDVVVILVQDELTAYVVDIVRATRTHDSVLVGASPRATQALILASRAYAVISGRDFVTPDDIKAMTRPVLDHRLILRPDYEIEGTTTTEVIDSILDQVAIPR